MFSNPEFPPYLIAYFLYIYFDSLAPHIFLVFCLLRPFIRGPGVPNAMLGISIGLAVFFLIVAFAVVKYPWETSLLFTIGTGAENGSTLVLRLSPIYSRAPAHTTL